MLNLASNTSRLGLLKKDPVADGNDTFNIKTMLNDNWDKLDAKVATLGPDGKVPADQLNVDTSNLATKTELQGVDTKVTAHLADYTQLKGDLSTLKTTAKDSIPNIVNELFTNVSDGKDLVGGAITDVDENVVIPTEPTFNDLANAIGQISTGKKWASGTAESQNIQAPYYTEYVTVNGLAITPSVVVVIGSAGQYYSRDGVSAMWKDGEVLKGNVMANAREFGIIEETSFRIPVYEKSTYQWIIFE